MSNLSSDQAAQLSNFSKKLKEEAAAQNQVVEQPNRSVEVPVVSDPTPEAVTPVEPVKVEPKEQPEQSQEKVQEETPEPEVIPAVGWDDELVSEETKVPSSFDFSKIGSALNSEVKDESDLISKITELQTKVKDFETKSAATPNVPDDFKEVYEIALKGGDWRSYVSEVDWSKQDPKDVYEQAAQSNPYFYDANGKFDEEKYWSVMDSTTDFDKTREGQRIIQQKMYEQQSVQQARLAQIEQARRKRDQDLAQASKKLSEILPMESFGIKFEQKHSDQLYKGISEGSLLQKHILDDKGGYDMNKLVKTIALAEYGEKMIKFKSQNAATQAKKELLRSTQNVNLNSPSAPAEPTGERPAKQLTAAEKMAKYIAGQKEAGRL